MRTILCFFILILPLSGNASHPVCSNEDGDFKMIVSKEEDLSIENLDKTLKSIREFYLEEKEVEYDDLTFSFLMSHLSLYYMNRKILKSIEAGKGIELNEEQITWYCRSIGKLPKTS